MTALELQQLLYEITRTYFSRATVRMGSQSGAVKPVAPFVKLSPGGVSRSRDARMDMEDGNPVSYYPSAMAVQVDLFTPGRPVEASAGISVPAENTAVNDLLAFVNFLDSPYGDGWCQEHDISILQNGPVQDVTALVGSTGFQYRAMVELHVLFTQEAAGYTGILESPAADPPRIIETDSGGGGQELAEHEGGYFTEAEVKEDTDGK